MKKNSTCSIIIVIHNSEKFIDLLVESINSQTVKPNQVIFVDTGSQNLDYIFPHIQNNHFSLVIGGKEIGFCKGNNIAMRHIPPKTDYILYLNPDAFLFPDFLEKSLAFMDDPKNAQCGMISGKLFGYNIDRLAPNQCYDTTGIFRKWYGKWYDRGQGEDIQKKMYDTIEEIPAICGALMFCRKDALDSVMLKEKEIFDSSFYMYKEDIDLSLRMRKKKWKLIYYPELQAYHCRGWNTDRKKMKRNVRLLSAKNELKIHLNNFYPIGVCYSTLKYLAVVIFNM